MLKNIFKIFVFCFLIFPLLSFAEEKILNFDIVISVNQDATINVTENINYDYDNLASGVEKHGLYRDIPYQYKANYGIFNFYFSDVSVDTDNFEYYKYGKYIRIDTNPDPDIHVSGVKAYSFKYKVDGSIGYFDDFDEIYWNATGNEWRVPIKSASAKIILPRPLPENQIKVSCYEGVSGSKENCSFRLLKNNGLVESIVFSSARILNPKEGMTVAVGFPKAVVYEPTSAEKTTKALKENIVFGVPLLVFLMMFYLWYTKGRDPKGTGVIIPQYDIPDGLSPMEVGVIMNEKSKDKDISAEIISLAIKGHLKIVKKDKEHFWSSKDYTLLRIDKEDVDKLKKYELFLLTSLFGGEKEVRLASLKDRFFKILSDLKGKVSLLVFSNGYYENNPESARNIYHLASFLLFFLSIFLAEVMGGTLSIALLLSSVIVVFFSIFMIKKTEKGVATREYILGLKDYLQIAEKDRINFHNAPEKRPEIFEKFLPYAMILGVEKAWAKEFEDIYTAEPSWYSGSNMNTFNLAVFTNNLNSFSSLASNTLSSAPGGSSGSGGGGSSGGGGGGGGGGSH